MPTIIIYERVHPSGYIYPDHPNTKCLPKEKNVKRRGGDHHDSCIRIEDKSKR